MLNERNIMYFGHKYMIIWMGSLIYFLRIKKMIQEIKNMVIDHISECIRIKYSNTLLAPKIEELWIIEFILSLKK